MFLYKTESQKNVNNIHCEHDEKGHEKANKSMEIVAKAGYDSDEQRENAHAMFIDDLQFLRQTYIQSL